MPNWKKLITSGSDASLSSLSVTNAVTASIVSASSGITGSLFGTASWARNTLTASYVNTLNQNVLITGSLTVGTSSIGANENTLVLGPAPAGGSGEGGQLLLQAPGGTYTSASMIDNWQNYTRLLRGTNASSDAVVAQWNMHSKQMTLPQYNSLSAFSGTAIAALGVDTSGNVITIQTGSQAGGSGVTINNNVDNYLITATGTANTVNGESNLQFNGSTLSVTGQITATGITSSGAVIAQANNAMYFRGGDDAELWDINVANTVGIYGQQDSTIASIKLGSGGGTISGRSGSIGIGTTTPTSASLTVSGNIWATSLTGSLFGTASWAVTSSHALTASYVNPLRQNVLLTGSLLVTQSYISKVDYIEFTSASDQPTAAARLGWNDSDGTLSLGLKGGNVDLLVGEAEFAYVYNAETSSLTKGTVVYISGSQGNRISVKRAFATTDAVSAGTIGFVAETITPGSTGFVATSGVIGKLDTSGYPAGALVYLSSSAGQYTTVKPQAPIHEVRLGYVQRVHPTVGSIYVKVDNGYEIEELHDVQIISASSGDLLTYSGSLWINSKQLTGSYGLTGSFGQGSGIAASGSYSHAEGNATIASGSYSHAEGIATSAIGNYSHAEGDSTKTGIQTAYSASISSGIVTMSAAYGDTSGNFSGNTKIYIYDSPFDSVYNAGTFVIKQSYYSAPNTIVELYNNIDTTTKAYILSYANGNFSTNAGDQTIPGVYAHAEGNQAVAIGEYSHAEGAGTAVGAGSHAEGINTLAIGFSSHAENSGAQAIGNYSHAEGNYTQAIGYSSHAEGNNVKAIGQSSHAEGTTTYTGYKGFGSNDIGSSNPGDIYLDSIYGDVSALFTAGNYIILSDTDDDNIYGTIQLQIAGASFDGTNTIITITDPSIATSVAGIGIFNDPEPAGANQEYIGWYSHAEGKITQAIGWYSHAEGIDTRAIGDASHAEGDTTIAYGYSSHTEGQYTSASGDYSHAEGISTTTYGDQSHAEGDSTATGQLGYNSTSIVAGFINLDSVYGNVKPDIDGLSDYIILDDRNYDNIYGYQLFEIAGVGAGPPTTIALVDTSVSTTQATIGVPGVAAPTNADIAITGRRSHSEGLDTIASGWSSHAAGIATNTVGDFSYAGGHGTIAYREGQTVVGKYNAISRPNQSTYNNSFVVGKGTTISSSANIFEVLPETNAIILSSSVYLAELTVDNTIQNVVSIAPSGQLYITTGSAFGGGGGPSTPAFPYTGSAIISGSLVVTGSITATQGITGSLFGTASWATNSVSSSYPFRVSGSTIYSAIATIPASFNPQHSILIGSMAGDSATNASQSVFLGRDAGISATTAYNSNFFGFQAGKGANTSNNSNFFGASAGNGATKADSSNFLGALAGQSADQANNSNFLGPQAGVSATNANSSNFFGAKAGNTATNANNSNFFGSSAGQNATHASGSNFLGASAGDGATNAAFSNFIGTNAGTTAISASYSTLIGYNVGTAPSITDSIWNHNIIIGTNISLPANASRQFNIGGVLFGTGLYNVTSGNPFTGSQTQGRIGINTLSPSYSLDVSGSGNFTNGLTTTGSFTVITGSSIEFQVLNTGVKIGSIISDVHTVTGSLNISGSINILKAGSGSAASFGGSPRTASFTFTTPFSNNNYAITVTGEDARTWTIQSKVSGSFVINSNSTVALTGPVYWIATPFNL